jgi:hypothetical protein
MDQKEVDLRLLHLAVTRSAAAERLYGTPRRDLESWSTAKFWNAIGLGRVGAPTPPVSPN